MTHIDSPPIKTVYRMACLKGAWFMRVIQKCKKPEKIAAFTGHRDLSWLGDKESTTATMKCMNHAILGMLHKGINTFLCGLALGADTLFADEIIRLKGEGHRMYLVGAIPSERQADGWTNESKTHYAYLRSQCDALYIHDNDNRISFSRACIARNQWMIINSSRLIALYDGRKSGGTAYTVAAARKRGLHIIIIN